MFPLTIQVRTDVDEHSSELRKRLTGLRQTSTWNFIDVAFMFPNYFRSITAFEDPGVGVPEDIGVLSNTRGHTRAYDDLEAHAFAGAGCRLGNR